MKYTVEESVANFKAWSGAVSTLNRIIEEGKEDAFEQLLEEMYLEELPTDTQINDLLWFESEYLFECLGISEDEDEEEIEEE